MANHSTKKQIDLLGEVPLFSSCSLAELRAIAKLGTQIGIPSGKELTKRGTPGREFFLILEGTASCKVGRREVARFSTGDYFGEMAILWGGYRTATVSAVTDMEVLVLDAREFRSLLMSNPSVSLKMLAVLAERVAEADAQYTD